MTPRSLAAASRPDCPAVRSWRCTATSARARPRSCAAWRAEWGDCRVSSPTFTIVNEYLGQRELIHFDMYRLSSADELFDIGWEDYLARGAVCVVEWSEKVQDALFGDEVVVRIDKLSDTERRITIDNWQEG